MTLLDKIIASKHSEVEQLKNRIPVSELQKSNYFQREAFSLSQSILEENSCGIIAEFKRRSPSAGVLKNDKSVSEVASGYCRAGASAVSVLTDSVFFGGTIHDLAEVRTIVDCPVLRKDFIIDEYQIIEARAAGADAILLISGVLSRRDLTMFHRLAKSIGLEVIVEIHEKDNIDEIPVEAQIIGINNRNLATLDIRLNNSEELITLLPSGPVKVAESGIRSITDYIKLKKAGFHGFLIGESFLRHIDPVLACTNFIKEIHGYKNKN